MVESKVFSVIFDDDVVARRRQRRKDASGHTSRMERVGPPISASSRNFEKRDFFNHQGRNLQFHPEEDFSSQRKVPMYKFRAVNSCLADQEESRDDCLNLISLSTPARNTLRINLPPRKVYPSAENLNSFRKMRALAISGRLSRNVCVTQPSLQTLERTPDLVDDLRREVERILAADPDGVVDPEHTERECEKDSVAVNIEEEDDINSTCGEECKDTNKESDHSTRGGEEDLNTTFIGERTDGDGDKEFALPFHGVWCALPAWKLC